MKKILILLSLFIGISSNVFAVEYQIGQPKVINGMNVGAVYLQAVKMMPHIHDHEVADIHLEADISATKYNKHGFSEGDWIPYLDISYHIKKKSSDWEKIGSFVPMVANDGPHYGENIKLDGAGTYQVTYNVYPPVTNGFFNHVDKETGVSGWWKPFTVSWEFKYIGVGKKGGY